MKLTTKGRYAVTAMLDLALHAQQGPVSLAEISTRQEISLSYLEQLFSRLRKHDLVASTRGPGGGYRVSRSLDKVAISEIIMAVNESVDALWEGLSEQIEEFLSGVSLQDLIDKQSVKTVAMRQDQMQDQMQDQLLTVKVSQ